MNSRFERFLSYLIRIFFSYSLPVGQIGKKDQLAMKNLQMMVHLYWKQISKKMAK
jgi:hypothetical protein